MSEPEGPGSSRPRFPFVAAALCAARVGAAVWGWMRYSYCWDFTPGELEERFGAEAVPDFHSEGGGGETGRYVRVSGTASDWMVGHATPLLKGSGSDRAARRKYVWLSDGEGSVFVRVPRAAASLAMEGKLFTFTGRVLPNPENLPLSGTPPDVCLIDATAGRFHGASVAGIVVGAMGVFVFGMALRHWIRRRRELDAPFAARPPR